MKPSGGQQSIPEGWRMVRLGDVAKVERGKFAHRPRNEVRFYGGDIPFIQTGDVVRANGKIRQHSQTLNELGLSISRLFPTGTVIITIAANIGETAIASYPVAFPDSLVGIIPTGIDANFLEHSLRIRKAHLNQLAPESAQKNINLDDLRPLLILLPTLPEQRAIAAVLDSIDDAIERTEAVIAATEQLRDSLLHQLLTRGVPGWHTHWKEAPGLGTIPADWEVARLGEGVTHVGSGVTPRGGKSAYTASGITFLRSQNVYFDGLRLEDVVYISSETDNAMVRSRVQSDDVLLNITGASIGRCIVAPGDLGPANVNQHVCIIRTTQAFNPCFVWKWLSTPRSQREIDDVQTGQSRQGLNYQQVRQLTIARPPRPEQDSIVEILSRVDAIIAEAKREREGLQLLKESTADALLTGLVRVTT